MENQEHTYSRRKQQHLRMVINIIACIDSNNAIGYKNQLLFHIPEDLTRFRMLTTGHTILMGRKTYESLPHGALPNRRNIVISHQNIHLEGCDVFSSIEKALDTCQDEEVFVIGGASIYEQTLSIADRLYLTKVHKACTQADTYFPIFNEKEWNLESTLSPLLHNKENKNMSTLGTNQPIRYSFCIYKKK